MTFSGVSPDGNLIEIAEFTAHPFMLGTQFHPEFLSRPSRPHPLFSSFIEATSSIVRSGTQAPLPLLQVDASERNEYERIEFGS